MHLSSRLNRLVLGLAAAVGLAPAAASACGGFFCSATPVDQQAERIVFVQEDETTLRAIVEIQYQGDRTNFAWVVPVPSVPELDTFYPQAFQALDLATQPVYNPPWQCLPQFEGDAAADGGAPNADEDGEVMVLDRRAVGPFDTATIESRDPDALVEWLRTNDFRIPEAMEPFIALYTNEGLKFLAMKLLPDQDVAAIRPISMRYAAQGPAVPLRLTAVAALLEMGVKVWVLGDGRFGPMNVPDLEVPVERVRFDAWTWQTNYSALVARLVDEKDAPAFVTEYAQPTKDLAEQIASSFVPDFAGQEAIDARDALAALVGSKPYITRLYTRVSPEEMDIDPIFHRVMGGDVSNVHDLPETAVEHCNDPGGGGQLEAADACEFAACGQAGRCAAVATEQEGFDAVGCACAEGTLARAMLDGEARGGARVGCADARLNFTAPALTRPEDPFMNPCAEDPCGANGECVSLNGSASCRCDVGFVTVAQVERSPDGVVTRVLPSCVAPKVPLPDDFVADLDPIEPNLPYPGRPGPMNPTSDPGPSVREDDPNAVPRTGTRTANSGDDEGCSVGSTRGASPLGALLVVAGLGLRRRRRAG